MKIIIGFLLTLSALNVSAAQLSNEAKAVSAAKALYALNIKPIKNAVFSPSAAQCDGDDTIETCVINISLKEKIPMAGGISYSATFLNNQLSTITQICPYCW